MDEIAVYFILGLTVFWVIKKNINIFKGKTSCSGCPVKNKKEVGCKGCPISQHSSQPIFQIEKINPTPKQG